MRKPPLFLALFGLVASGEAPLLESYLWETGQTRARTGGGKSE